jgi:ribosomal protein S18 acetylase RimI-like enzyme
MGREKLENQPRDALMLRILEIAHRSPAYERAVRLREAVLRRPLGLAFTAQELADEARSHHIVALEDDGEDEDGACVGCLVLRPIDDGVVRMRQVAVRPDRRRQGIGRALVGFAERSARARGYREVVAHVREPVIPFYASLGYELTGSRFIEVTLPHFPMRKLIVDPGLR